jgi:hypothetical protein
MNSPILFLVFNRPEVTQRVFNRIRQAQPKRLYIAADAPRLDRPGEAERCQEVRNIISKIDWPCAVHQLLRDQNLGCKMAVTLAIDWFFANESEGIILEDDCLPHPDFFPYCDELLARYRVDERVGLISGTALGDCRAKGLLTGHEDYLFTRYPSIWGWASWRRFWKDYDPDIKLWKTYRNDISVLTTNPKLRRRNDELFDKVANSKIDTWDYQVSFLLWSTGRLSICPRVDLIENIGFGPDATHTQFKPSWYSNVKNLNTLRLSFPLRYPEIIAPNYAYQKCIEKISTRSIFLKIVDRLKAYLDRSLTK